jgi:hypothetical protein
VWVFQRQLDGDLEEAVLLSAVCRHFRTRKRRSARGVSFLPYVMSDSII